MLHPITLLSETAPTSHGLPPSGWAAIGGAAVLALIRVIAPYVARKLDASEKRTLADEEAKNERLRQADADRARRLEQAETTVREQGQKILTLATANARLEQAIDGLTQRFEECEMKRAHLRRKLDTAGRPLEQQGDDDAGGSD